MAARNWLLVGSGSYGIAQNANTTYFYAVMGTLYVLSTTEADVQQVVRDTLTVSGLFVRVIANTMVNDSVYTFMIGGVAKTNTVTFSTGETGTKQDTTHSDALVAGNLIDTRLATGVAGVSITTSIIAYQLQHASSDVPILGSAGLIAINNSVTGWLWIIGDLRSYVSPESSGAYKVRVAGTLSNMRVYVSANTNTKDGTLTSRVNSGAGTQTVTITGSGTGSFEDTTHTDSVSAAQTISMQIVTGSKSGTSTTFTVCQYKYAAIGQIIGCGAGLQLSYAEVYYKSIGERIDTQPTELNTQLLALMNFTAKNLLVNCTAYTLDAEATVALRVDGVNSALTVGVAGTGYTEDTTHSVDVTSANLINFIMDMTAASSGSINLTYVGFELDQPSAAVAVVRTRSHGYIIV